jgi:WhiB family transcriptional regulator, redox-sensing transcriptional regulator
MVLRRDDEYDELQWQHNAACRGDDSSLFYPPPRFEGKDARLRREHRAKAICARCEVRAECLADALRTAEPHGIWGGLNELERRETARRQS